MKKILIVLLNAILVFSFIGFYYTVSFATEANLSIPSSVTVGDDITVTVKIPSEAVAYQGEISVKFSDGTTANSGVLAKVTGIDGDYSHPGNMTFTTKATKEGEATVTVSNLNITDKNSNKVNIQSGLTGKITVNKKQEAQPSQPTTPTTNTSTTPSTPASSDPTFTTVSEKVFATETVNVRKSWSTSSESIGKIQKGSSVVRIGKGSNGWDKVSYIGTFGYVSSKYLTTQDPNGSTTTTTNTTTNTNTNTTNTTTTTVAEPKWTETGDTVYATTNMNVRKSWDKSSESIGGLMKGDKTTRIAVGSNGWDKIKYEGKTAYVLSSLLTTQVVEPDKKEETNTTNTNTNTTNTTNTVAESNTNKVDVTENMAAEEKDVYNQLIEEVGVLPAVGRNFADYVYVIGLFVVLAMVGFVGVKIREKED